MYSGADGTPFDFLVLVYCVAFVSTLRLGLKAECNHTPLTTFTSTLFYLIALLPVIDCKGLEASDTCWHNSLRPRVLRVHILIDSLESSRTSWINTDIIDTRYRYLLTRSALTYLTLDVCGSLISFSLQPPTPERARSLLGRRSHMAFVSRIAGLCFDINVVKFLLFLRSELLRLSRLSPSARKRLVKCVAQPHPAFVSRIARLHLFIVAV